jgi:hypothetical protein
MPPVAFCRKASFSFRAGSRTTTAPPTISEWPPIYLVTECATMSIPWSSGRCTADDAKVLSTTVMMPRSRPIAATASRSASRSSALPVVSIQMNAVFGASAARIDSGSAVATWLIVSPAEWARTRWNSRQLPP